MKYRLIHILSFAIFFMPVVTLISSLTLQNGFSASAIEEGQDTVFAFDDVISGKFKEYANRTIYIDGLGYKLCKNVKIFNPVNMIISDSDIEGAVEVKLFQNNGCIRKIKILRYAE